MVSLTNTNGKSKSYCDVCKGLVIFAIFFLCVVKVKGISSVLHKNVMAVSVLDDNRNFSLRSANTKIQWLQRSITFQDDKNNVGENYLLGLAFFKLGDKEYAKDLWLQSIDKRRTSILLVSLGKQLYNRGDYNTAEYHQDILYSIESYLLYIHLLKYLHFYCDIALYTI